MWVWVCTCVCVCGISFHGERSMKSFCLHTSDQNESSQEKNPKLFSCQQFPGTFFSLCTHVCQTSVCVRERCGKLKCLANICYAKKLRILSLTHTMPMPMLSPAQPAQAAQSTLAAHQHVSQSEPLTLGNLRTTLTPPLPFPPHSPKQPTLPDTFCGFPIPWQNSPVRNFLRTTKMPRTLLIFIGLKINWTESYKFLLLLLCLHLIFGKNKMRFPCQRKCEHTNS